LGSILKDQGEVDGAIEALQHAVALDATDAGAFNNLGLLLKRKGDVEGAKKAFEKAAEIRKSDEDRKEKSLRAGSPH
jgi:Flp pilus assembly protein TadD